MTKKWVWFVFPQEVKASFKPLLGV